MEAKPGNWSANTGKCTAICTELIMLHKKFKAKGIKKAIAMLLVLMYVNDELTAVAASATNIVEVAPASTYGLIDLLIEVSYDT